MPARVRIQHLLPGVASIALVFVVMLILFGPIVLLAVISFDRASADAIIDALGSNALS